MITLSFAPLSCKFSESYDNVVKNKNVQTGVFYGKSIKLKNVTAHHVLTDAVFTKIKRSRIDEIVVTGNLCLEACEAGKVIATNDIFIFGCKKIDYIEAGGSIHIVHPCESDSVFAGLDVINYYLMDKPISFLTIEDCAGMHYNLDPAIKHVEIKGDCSKIDEIVFRGDLYCHDERLVTLRKGAIFNGKVTGGKLVSEEVFNEAL